MNMANKEKLIQKLKEIDEILKEMKGVHYQPLMNFCSGMKINKKNDVTFSIVLPGEEILEEADLRCVTEGKWKMVPILMFVEE
jgi:hypothetical protein